VEFAPRWAAMPPRTYGQGLAGRLRQRGMRRDGYVSNSVYSYAELRERMLGRPASSYPLFRGACPAWDNSPRRKTNATIFEGASPALFRSWLERLIDERQSFAGEPAPVFVNSWNEWAEGAQLEPCTVYGRQFLDAVKAAVSLRSSAQVLR